MRKIKLKQKEQLAKRMTISQLKHAIYQCNKLEINIEYSINELEIYKEELKQKRRKLWHNR